MDLRSEDLRSEEWRSVEWRSKVVWLVDEARVGSMMLIHRRLESLIDRVEDRFAWKFLSADSTVVRDCGIGNERLDVRVELDRWFYCVSIGLWIRESVDRFLFPIHPI